MTLQAHHESLQRDDMVAYLRPFTLTPSLLLDSEDDSPPPTEDIYDLWWAESESVGVLGVDGYGFTQHEDWAPSYPGDKGKAKENHPPVCDPFDENFWPRHFPIFDASPQRPHAGASEISTADSSSPLSKKRKQREDDEVVVSSLKSLRTSTNTFRSTRLPTQPPTTLDLSRTHVPAYPDSHTNTNDDSPAASHPFVLQSLPDTQSEAAPTEPPQGHSTLLPSPSTASYDFQDAPTKGAGSSTRQRRSESREEKLARLAAKYGVKVDDIRPIPLKRLSGTCRWKSGDGPCEQDLNVLSVKDAASHLSDHIKHAKICQWVDGAELCGETVGGMRRHVIETHLKLKQATCQRCGVQQNRPEQMVYRHLPKCLRSDHGVGNSLEES